MKNLEAMTISERLFYLLEKENLKSSDLANILGVGTGQISTWKKRNTDPPSKFIAQICEFLNIEPNYLLTGKGNVEKSLNTSDMSNRILSKNIKKLRTQYNFSPEYLAMKLHLTSETIYHYESGASSPSIETLINLANIFCVPTDAFLDIESDNISSVFFKKFTMFLSMDNIPIENFLNYMQFTHNDFQNWITKSKNVDCFEYIPIVACFFKIEEKYLYPNDILLSPLNDVEEYLLTSYKKLTEVQQYMILGKISEMIENNTIDPASALFKSETEVPKTGTDNLKK